MLAGDRNMFRCNDYLMQTVSKMDCFECSAFNAIGHSGDLRMKIMMFSMIKIMIDLKIKTIYCVERTKKLFSEVFDPINPL